MSKYLFIASMIFLIYLPLACRASQAPPVEKREEIKKETPSPPGKLSWEAEWEKTLTEARREGKVVVYGPPGSDVRKALAEDFQKAFSGIEVEYVGVPPGAMAPKIRAERRAGISTVDVHISGTQSILSALMENIVPIEPLLILPEVKDKKYWKDGEFDFADKAGKSNFVFSIFAKVAIVYNPSLLEPARAQAMSYWDLTKLDLKGKVVARDPRTPGPGQTSFMFLYAHPQLGPDLIRAMAKNDVVLSRDDRQILEFVSRGKYEAAIGHSDLMLTELKRLGITNIKTQPSLKEGTYTTAGYGTLVLFDNTPHPKAAKVYINWLLSKEGQTTWAKNTSYPSRRVDVTTEYSDPEALVKSGVKYINTYNEEALGTRDRLVEVLRDVFTGQ